MIENRGDSRKTFVTRSGITLIIGLFITLGTFSARNVYAADSAKRVLIFSSADVNTPAITTLNRSIRSTLQQTSASRIQFYNEALEALRIPSEKYETEMLRLLQRKYDGEQIDLIICLAVDSLKFLLKHENELFSKVPKVFVAHDRREMADVALNENVAGVVGKTELGPVIEDALRFQPDTRRVVVIAGNSALDKFWLEAARADFQRYQNRVEFSYLTDFTIEELKPQLAVLPAQTIVFFISFTFDRNGVSYTAPEAVGLLASSSNAPVYAPVETQLGHGIIGGHLFSYEALGTRAGEIAAPILDGAKPSAFGVQTVESVPMFDWRQLRRWGLSEAMLPAGSRVFFKDPTFWDLYKWRIIGTVALVTLQTLFIVALLIERKRRRRAKESLDRLNVELEQRVVDRTAALDAKSRELEAFAYSVAHDLKAPLRGIDGYSRLLLEDYSDLLPAEGQKFVQTICTATTDMSELIEDLLEYARLDRRELRQDRIEIQPFISSLVERLKQESAGRNIEFLVNVNGLQVLADSIGLTQALKNYLDNAIKFTAKCKHAKIEVGSEETADGCILWVRDNGVGFDMKHHDRIFGIFQRLNSAEEYPGTGIGLAIVRKAMDRMGGRAWAKSIPGEGSTFYLEIARPAIQH
jgi:signal transduction histidine kinase